MNDALVSPSTLLVLYCALVLFAALAGGALPMLLRLSHTRLQMAISCVAGLMLGVALLGFMSHASHELQSIHGVGAWMLAGFLVMFLLQRFLPFHHHEMLEDKAEAEHEHVHEHEHSHAESVAPHLNWAGVAIGLSLHSIFDGLALATAVAFGQLGHGSGLGLGTALAIILHKPFGAMAITTLMTASGASQRWRHIINVVFALVTPVAALLFFLGAGHFIHAHGVVPGATLAFCAGTFLCISCADLLPELQFHRHDRIKLSVALLLGLSMAVLISKFGHPEHEHDSPPAAGASETGH